MAKHIIIGCVMLGLLMCTQSAVGAQYDYERDYRYSGRDAVDMDDWLERGRAAVTESPVFSDGIRLTAWGGAEASEPGLASAIYYFPVPLWAQYLTIKIRYKDTGQDDKIAGRLWIKSIDNDMRGEIGAGEEAPFYGDTFVLRSERLSETITVPSHRHVEAGMVEMHIVVEGKDGIDVRDIRIEYLETRPQITVVHRTHADYWHWWPRHRYAYHYYYWGPLFWPRTLVVYECWDVPSPFYWITWRPWFFINIIRAHHHHPWWGPRRYTVVYHVDVKQPLIKRRTLLRTRLREHQVQVTRIIRPKTAIQKTDRSPVRTQPFQKQEVRLTKEAQTPRTFEAKANQNPTQRHLKEQPVRADKGRERPRVDTQTKTVTSQRIRKDQAQPRTAVQTQTPRPKTEAREAIVQAPVQKQLKKPDTEVKPAPVRRPNTKRLAQEKKEPERLTKNKQTKTVKRPQVVNKSDARPARPSHTASQRIHKDQAQQQPRTRSVTRETVREPTRVHAAQDQRAKQEGAVQKQTTIGQRARPQSHREMRQPRPDAGQRRHR
jgi:hypothetical protein